MEAIFLLLFWHIVGKLLPLNWYKRFFGKRIPEVKTPEDLTPTPVALKISHTIYVAAWFLPWTPSCYPQALAAKSMLKRRRVSSLLYFGAATGDGKQVVKLHCWISHHGTILTGKAGHEDYKVIQVYS